MQPRTVSTSLKQRHLLFGRREFTLKGNTHLLVREKSLLVQFETLLPLSTLHPDPTQASSFAMKWLLNGMFLASLTGLISYCAHQFSLPILYIFAAVSAGSTLVMLYRFALYTTRLTIFRHAGTNENYLYLWHNRPDKKRFEAFVKELNLLIRANGRNTKSP